MDIVYTCRGVFVNSFVEKREGKEKTPGSLLWRSGGESYRKRRFAAGNMKGLLFSFIRLFSLWGFTL
jgi:hypothetical protein